MGGKGEASKASFIVASSHSDNLHIISFFFFVNFGSINIHSVFCVASPVCPYWTEYI